MTEKKNNVEELERREPPTELVKSVQFDLFNTFVTNDKNKVSNSVEVWETIPKYFFTPEQIKKLRNADGLAKPFKFPYTRDGQQFICEIQPALIEDKDGNYKAYFPSYTEELVEDALKKILTVQNLGIHDPAKHETWIRFTLSMISKELRAMNCGRDRKAIKHALAVMSGCILTLYRGKKEVWRGSILQDLVTVDREQYIEDSNAYHVARLPLFVSHAIDRLQYRQFNYERLMHCKGQLSKWILKKLINRYVQANYITKYHFLYSDLKNSGYLQCIKESDNRRKAIEAFEELIVQGALITYQVTEKKEGRKIVDMLFHDITPSREFINEQTAANKRATDNRMASLQAGHSPSVDKLL